MDKNVQLVERKMSKENLRSIITVMNRKSFIKTLALAIPAAGVAKAQTPKRNVFTRFAFSKYVDPRNTDDDYVEIREIIAESIRKHILHKPFDKDDMQSNMALYLWEMLEKQGKTLLVCPVVNMSRTGIDGSVDVILRSYYPTTINGEFNVAGSLLDVHIMIS